MEQGWIKLSRKLSEWEWYDNPNVFRLFIHCLLKANHKTKNWRGQTVNKGSFITSRDVLAKELKLTPQQIRTALNKLKSTNEITIKSTSLNTSISIVKWDSYQQDNQQNNKPITNQQQTNNKPITTTKNDKNVKNDKNEKKNIIIPSYLDFEKHALSKIPNLCKQGIKLKYEAWLENDWKDGNNTKIVNWKSKLTNTVQFLKKLDGPEFKDGINIDNYEIPHMDHFGYSIEQLTDRINQGKYKLK